MLVVPAAAVLDAAQTCISRQIGGAVVFAAGFAETGAQGRARFARAVATIGALMRLVPELTEIEINPMIVHPEAAGVEALDALIIAA